MFTYSNLKKSPELLRMKTKDGEIKNSKNKTEKHDHEILLKAAKIDNEYHRKKYKSLSKKKIFVFFTEMLLRSRSAVNTSTMSLINSSLGIVLTISTALPTSVATLITNEHIS